MPRRPRLSAPTSICPASLYASKYLQIPAAGTENDDHNPPRIASRNLFDIGLGDDNLFHGDKRKWSARVTVVNMTNKEALYNFLSTFSGTHYVTPRTISGTLGFHFYELGLISCKIGAHGYSGALSTVGFFASQLAI